MWEYVLVVYQAVGDQALSPAGDQIYQDNAYSKCHLVLQWLLTNLSEWIGFRRSRSSFADQDVSEEVVLPLKDRDNLKKTL